MINQELLAVLARRGRIALIRTLKSFPDRDFTINELSRVSGIPTMTTWRAVGEFKAVGIVKMRRVGNAKAVKITRDPGKLRLLRLIEDTDPQKAAAKEFASSVSEMEWGVQCRLFGPIGRGEHLPGEEVDIAVVFDDLVVSEHEAKDAAQVIASDIRKETNVTIVPLCIPVQDMRRKGGLAAELRDKEVIWSREA